MELIVEDLAGSLVEQFELAIVAWAGPLEQQSEFAIEV